MVNYLPGTSFSSSNDPFIVNSNFSETTLSEGHWSSATHLPGQLGIIGAAGIPENVIIMKNSSRLVQPCWWFNEDPAI